MPFDRKRYPKNWPEISAEIRERSGGRCECEGECGLHPDHRCVEVQGAPARWAKGRIILTVAHLNHKPRDVRRKNLKAMCQRCHLRYDHPLHMKNARATRRQKKAIKDLFE